MEFLESMYSEVGLLCTILNLAGMVFGVYYFIAVLKEFVFNPLHEIIEQHKCYHGIWHGNRIRNGSMKCPQCQASHEERLKNEQIPKHSAQKLTYPNIQQELFDLADTLGNSDDYYINYMVENGDGLSREHAKAFVGILTIREIYGKEEALRRFKLYIEYLIDTSGGNLAFNFRLRRTVSFLCGALAANHILTKTESDSLSDYYSNIFNAELINK